VIVAAGAPSSGPNPHVVWRMAIARRVAKGYDGSGNLAALTVAGSVGAGVADCWSDLEVDCYWLEPPSDADRREPIDRAGGVVTAFWDYDWDDREWSEDYRVGPLTVTASNFTVATVEGFLDAVVDQADPDPVKHMRLAAIQRCQPLQGAELVRTWRARAEQYPDQLVDVMIERSLTADTLAGWSARHALLDRGDGIAVHALLSRIEQAIFSTVLALNRVYEPHRVAKWQRHLLTSLDIAPDDLGARLASLWQGSELDRIVNAEALLTEMLALVKWHSSAALGDFRERFAEHRPPAEPPDAAGVHQASQ
jgi:hypothetical protein